MLELIQHAGDRVLYKPEDLTDRDAVFEHVCELYPDLRIEMNEDGSVLLMAPGSITSSFGSSEVFGQLLAWTHKDGSGRALDGTVVYNLATGAKMSPDASWVSNAILRQHGKAALSKVTGTQVTPLFVIEVRSPSDRLKDQVRKCERWVKAQVAEVWLVDPTEQTVRIFGEGSDLKLMQQPKEVASRVLQGFVLDCAPVWADF